MARSAVALFTLRDAPAAARLATQWACPPDLLDWPVLVGEALRRRDLRPKLDGVRGELAADLGALIGHLAEGLREILGAEGALQAGFAAASTLEAARVALAGRTIWVPEAPRVEKGRVAEALALLDADGLEGIVDWVQAGGPAPGWAPVAAAFDPAALGVFVAEALGPRPERWEPEPAGRLLDLWVALRASDAPLPLEESDDEGLFDRAGLVSAMLAARGLPPAQRWDCVPRRWGSGRLVAAAALVQADQHVAEATSDEAAAGLCLRLLDLGPALGSAPTLRAAALQALEMPDLAPFLGPWALVAAVESFGPVVARAITAARWEALLTAQLGLRGTLALAQTLAQAAPSLHRDRPAAATARLFSGPRLDAEALEAARSVVALLDGPTAWRALLDQLEGDPQPEPAGLRSLLALLRALGRPPGGERLRLGRLCATRGPALEPALVGLCRLAGVAAPAGAADPLAALDEALAAAGLALAPGNSPDAIDAAEAQLGAPLPPTLREFFAAQDGSGG